jgi:hypothetical protein
MFVMMDSHQTHKENAFNAIKDVNPVFLRENFQETVYRVLADFEMTKECVCLTIVKHGLDGRII